VSTENDIQDENFRQAERYLRSEMSPQEKEAFRRRIETDQQLKEQVDEYRLLLFGIQEAVLQEKMKEFHKELPITMEPKRKTLKMWLAAASVLISISVAAWLFFNRNTSDNLFAAYFTPDPGLISSMGNSENYLFDRAMVDYKTGEYEQAISVWKGLLRSNTNSDTLNYFVGAAYLAMGQANMAEPYLAKVAAVTESAFADDASWYTGLALIRQGNKKEAVPYIQRSTHKGKEVLLKKLQE
jgi:tetratricopeptide (TPR) repeat protein